MAKVVGLIGSAKGKIGNTVFVVRRGTQISRVYQPSVHNPKSKRQELSRAKMAAAVAGLKPLTRALRAGWSQLVPGYEFQKAISIAIPANNLIITQIDPLTPPRLQMSALAPLMSASQLARPASTGAAFEVESTVKYTISVPESAFYDEEGSSIGCGVVTVVINPAAEDAHVDFHALTAGSSNVNVSVSVPEAWSGMEVVVYCFLKQIPEASNGMQSNTYPWMFPAKTSGTLYLGEGTIA